MSFALQDPNPVAGNLFRHPRLMRRIERLINLIAALLEARIPMSADEIRSQIAGYDQENYESFRRTFERDKEALRAMGIPIEVHQADPLGRTVEGYTIPKDRYYLPDLDLEPDELAALRLAANAILGAGDAAEAGLMKLSLEADAGPPGAPGIAWGADLAAEQPLLAPLYGAVTERRPVSFSYTRPAGTPELRAVEPYGLVHRRGHWYLVGRDRDRDALRVFKVSRIADPVQVLPGSYEIPEDFDAAEVVGGEAWERGGEKATPATVRFAPSLRWWAEQNLSAAERRDDPDGWLVVEWPVANLDALISWVVSFGPDVEILAPPEARARLLRHLNPWLGDGR